jgi:hypothetical protein
MYEATGLPETLRYRRKANHWGLGVGILLGVFAWVLVSL